MMNVIVTRSFPIGLLVIEIPQVPFQALTLAMNESSDSFMIGRAQIGRSAVCTVQAFSPPTLGT